jgi:hypothetical protein
MTMRNSSRTGSASVGSRAREWARQSRAVMSPGKNYTAATFAERTTNGANTGGWGGSNIRGPRKSAHKVKR